MSRFTEADRLLRLIVRERVQCERCGGPGSQVAHIVRRRYNAVRCDERNVWWLCNGPGTRECHRRVDVSAEHYDLLVFQTIGWDLHAELRALAHAGPSEPLSAFWKSETARLRQICADRGITYRRSA